ncbi:MAG: hypothetical protein DKM23_02555 [Candidatus Melainabacteria bacterium]|nr:MAG: hypothetical protein DKM24_06315 [Candidatus Melainabacteria bacterium]RAI12400.1 MAG: hypothetical protein DKM23_02555 [Candidatus Melainabacteria bacterium]
MPFVYRLQKVLDFRIRKKEEQLMVLQKAQQALYEAEADIQRNNAEIEATKQNQRHADFTMMEAYDNYLHHLWEKAEQLELVRQEKEEIVQQEMQKLVELEQAVKVLEKHKEKSRDAYIAEEKAAELKNMSELGVQRYFQQSRETREEQELLEQYQREIEREHGN